MSEDTPNTPLPDSPLRRKLNWYANIFFILITLWAFSGIRGFLLLDIPLLLFVCICIVLFILPIARWAGCTPRTWRVYFITVAYAFCVMLCLYLLLLFVIPPFAISPETTYLTEPRAKDYYGIDYQAAIEKEIDPRVPPENNGFRPLFETFGKSLCDREITDQHWNRFCQYLDLVPDLIPKQTFVPWLTFVDGLSQEEKEIRESAFFNGYATFPEKMIPIAKRWLDENGSALNQFAEAAQKPVMYLPPTFNNKPIYFSEPNNDNVFHVMVHSFVIRIQYYQAINETDKAWNDVLTIYRLAEHHRRMVWDYDSFLYDSGFLGTADQLAESIIKHSDMTSDDIRRKAEEVLPFRQPYRDEEIIRVLRNSRFIALDTIRLFLYVMDDMNPNDRWSRFIDRNVSILFRRGYAMIEINKHYDELERRFFNDIFDLPEVNFNINIFRFIAWYGEFVAGPILIGQFIGNTTSYNSLTRIGWNRHTNISLTQITFALESYRRDHNGSYPDKLDDLREHYLAEIPLDPFSGKPFRYVVKPPADDESESVLLYSVGPNGIDEEGRDRKDEDDICRRFVKE